MFVCAVIFLIVLFTCIFATFPLCIIFIWGMIAMGNYNQVFGVQVFAIHLPECSERVIPCVMGVNGESRSVSHTCRAK